MAYISYNKLWESEFDGIVSKRDKLQDLNFNQLKLEVHDTYKKDEKIITNFEPVDNSDVINKSYLDSKLLKIDGHSSKLEKNFNEFKLQYNKQSVEEILIQRAVKTTIQILYDRGLFDNFQNAEEVLKDFLFVTRHRGDLEIKNESQIFIFYTYKYMSSYAYTYTYMSNYTLFRVYLLYELLYVQLYEYLYFVYILLYL